MVFTFLFPPETYRWRVAPGRLYIHSAVCGQTSSVPPMLGSEVTKPSVAGADACAALLEKACAVAPGSRSVYCGAMKDLASRIRTRSRAALWLGLALLTLHRGSEHCRRSRKRDGDSLGPIRHSAHLRPRSREPLLRVRVRADGSAFRAARAALRAGTRARRRVLWRCLPGERSLGANQRHSAEGGGVGVAADVRVRVHSFARSRPA